MTDFHLRSGQLHRGLGFVARWPEIALVIPSEKEHDGLVHEIFDSLDAEPAARDLAAAVKEHSKAGRLRSAGMVIEATGSLLAVAYGSVEILVEGEPVASGPAWTETQITEASAPIVIRSTNLSKAAEPVAPFNLQRGVAPGAGITLMLKAISQPPAPELIEPPSLDNEEPMLDKVPTAQSQTMGSADGEPFTSVLLINQAPPEMLPPLPLATAGDHNMQDSSIVNISGVSCSRGHFNNPQNDFCMVCGISLLHLEHEPVMGPRPTLGFVVFDDGSTFGLDRSYIVGRDPKAESNGIQHLRLRDNNETLSRTHAELKLVDWNVQLTDLGSTNGTYIWDSTSESWTKLRSGQPYELSSGETVAVGRRTFVFEGIGHRP